MSRAGSDDAPPLDLGRNGATGAKAGSDAPVDLEKGAAGAKAAATEGGRGGDGPSRGDVYQDLAGEGSSPPVPSF
jgi:hypothetical protein